MPQQHRYSVTDATLDAKTVKIDHPNPTGAEILAAVGLIPPDEHILLGIMPNGDFEDVRLTEHTANETRKFIAFHSDRLYRFTLDTRQLGWGEPSISGSILEKLLGPADIGKDIVQRRHDGTETVIEKGSIVRLDEQGTEHLVTRARTFVIVVNTRRKTTSKESLTFEELILLAFEKPPTGEGVQFTIQFTRGPEANASGTLLEGQSVKIKNGMEFDVTPTNRS
ncbi:multiubiquitin domain-containing protein [Hyphomicrobium facile]|uniref:Multiubiquitin n=1 Tax=Hyphomicrobium facile TaxID=51670 RepID=A0A1I7N451_9HYPH|nr:multiubiquitin domain-containing protein [Hyphomicrobium facile]SFV29445.1 Multiubiquitin [Hyphomicrobium facile]